MERKTLIYAAAAAAVAVAIGVAALLTLRTAEIEGLLDGSGQVRGTEVTISARVGGVAEAIAAKEGQIVKRGELLARIDARDIEARLAQAKAQAEAVAARRVEAGAQLKALDTSIEQARMTAGVSRESSEHEVHGGQEAVQRAEAEVKAAEAVAEQDGKQLERYAALAKQGFVSQTFHDEVRARSQASEARLQAARKAREEAVASLERARAGAGGVKIKERDVKRLGEERERMVAAIDALARTEEAARARVAEVEAALDDTRLVAPTDGTVVNRLAEPGELVPPGRPIVTLIDLNALYVRVYIPEREIAKIRLGNPARIYADAFPERPFEGKVVEVAERAEFTPKEVHMKDERQKLVFGVKVAIDNPEGHLKPGMPVDVKIKWQDEASWPKSR